MHTITRFATLISAAGAAGASGQPIGDWYGTMSNFGGARMATVQGGASSMFPAAFQSDGPIAVGADVRTMGLWPNTPGSTYSLGGSILGPTLTHPSTIDFTFDGTTDGFFNYTVDTTSGNVYQLDLNWQNPMFLFSVGHSSQGGIAYDCATNSLWVAQEGGCQPSGQCGITGSVGNYTLGGTLLSAPVFANSGLLNDLAIDLDGTFWAHATTVGGDMLFRYDAAGTPLGTYPINIGTQGDTIRGAEISCVPEPSSLAMLSLAALPLLTRARRIYR